MMPPVKREKEPSDPGSVVFAHVTDKRRTASVSAQDDPKAMIWNVKDQLGRTNTGKIPGQHLPSLLRCANVFRRMWPNPSGCNAQPDLFPEAFLSC